MTYIAETLRNKIIQRASKRCEYCLIHQDDTFLTHEIDHIIPEKHRGKTDEDNLCLSCFECNRYKGSDFASFDPENDEITTLFNPRTDKWENHFRLDGARIHPLSPKGRVTVFVLKLNEDYRLSERRRLILGGSYP